MDLGELCPYQMSVKLASLLTSLNPTFPMYKRDNLLDAVEGD
jgi:hypothetical protein